MRAIRLKSLEYDSRRNRPRWRWRWRRQPSAVAAAQRAGLPGKRPAAARASVIDWVPDACRRTSTGTEVVHLQQTFRGLRVYRSAVVVKARSGRVRASPGGVPLPPNTRTSPRVSAEEALEVGRRFLCDRRALPKRVSSTVLRQSTFVLRARPTVLDCDDVFDEPARAHLEVFPVRPGRGRLAWVLEVAPPGRPRAEVVVSADTRRPAVLFCHQTTCLLQFRGTWLPYPGETRAGVFPLDPFAAPLGSTPDGPTDWAAGSEVARGPNVSCQYGGDTRLKTALVRNPFVWCNYLHDFFGEFGFDSRLGAFDEGVDPLLVKAFRSQTDQGGCFENTVDGASPRMKLYAPTSSTGTHAALDPGILIHEYAHGVTSRLLGGGHDASPFTGKEGQGLSEGYSDYFALTVLSYVDRMNGNGRDLRVIGGAFKPTNGIRRYDGFGGKYSAGLEDYQLGMVWCAGLLDARDGLTANQSVTPDDADRYLWQALLDSLTEMAPRCPKHDCVTLEHAADALCTASRKLERKLGCARMTEKIRSALSGRRIA
jgi:extracellular elastinolytic metalloproteinase